MTLSTSHFNCFHAAIHEGKRPFSWQQRLLEQVVRDRSWPRVLDLPTGTGKTTCIDIALFALALDVENDDEVRWCPRRIAMIVDRRVVVDQVAERGRAILRGLVTSTDKVVVDVADRLRSLTRTGDDPLGVFTLRGGMPKDDGWARTPDQPLVIASTVDQIGSRMLIQGYGVSQSMKPVHAGLLANDTLLLLDEVHLSEPFRQTLDQLARLRERFSGSGLKSRVSHAFLSATPGEAATEPFSLLEEEKSADSPLGPRLHASKPVRLIEVDDRITLESVCVEQARDLLERHRTIAVVVNRVGSAGKIARQLDELLKNEATVALLTGRMRPLDRDDVIRGLRPAVKTGRARSVDSPKCIIVATQCIEAGADFDFDAIITEASSIDSLRQRFGRVDRLGEYGFAEGVIVWDTCAKFKEELRRRGERPSLADDDPIYGKAIVETVGWFKEQQKERPRKFRDEIRQLKERAKKAKGEARKQIVTQLARLEQVDFGVLAIDVPHGADLTKLLAPKANAPTLLPAYLDLWMQTSPAPSQLPDVGLWLHGPSSGPADVQVIWRADLSEEVLLCGDAEHAKSVVAAVRPSSLEAVSLPFVAVRRWLTNLPAFDLGDTQGAMSEDVKEMRVAGRLALRWNGDKSEIVAAISDSKPSLKPGDTIVVPVSYGGIRGGCFDTTSTEAVKDLAEQAELFARARPVLRLHPEVLDKLGLALPSDDPEEARSRLGRLAENADWPSWKRIWAEKLAKGQGLFVVPGQPAWTVIQAKRVPIEVLRAAVDAEQSFEYGVEVTTDGDDSFCVGRAVPLVEHCNNVEMFAREFSKRCGLGSWLTEHVAFAAWLHDIGKADRRFQVMLRGGSEIDYFKDETPWAKSAMKSGARAARKLARERSGYPSGGYFHAIQSVAMLDGMEAILSGRLRNRDASKEPDLDLVLYLIASHHGECRPFAPAVIDLESVEVTLGRHACASFGDVDFSGVQLSSTLHRLDSPLADRFWSLVARYGWQELCWLEAILRLADHRASEDEQIEEELP